MSTRTNIITFPQRRRKSGFTQVPNDLLELCMSARFRGPKASVLLAVARLTLGWGQDRARLTLEEIAEAAEMSKSHVSKVLKELEEMGALEVVYTRQGRVIGIIDDYAALSCPTVNPTVNRLPGRQPQVDCESTLSSLDKESKKEIPPIAPLTADAEESKPAEQPAKPKRSRKQLVTFTEFLADCKAKGEKPIPPDHPAFTFAEETGIPVEWLRVAWLEFARRYRDADKGYQGIRGWRQAFNNAVRGNWMRVWYTDRASGEVRLTTEGVLLLRSFAAREEESV